MTPSPRPLPPSPRHGAPRPESSPVLSRFGLGWPFETAPGGAGKPYADGRDDARRLLWRLGLRSLPRTVRGAGLDGSGARPARPRTRRRRRGALHVGLCPPLGEAVRRTAGAAGAGRPFHGRASVPDGRPPDRGERPGAAGPVPAVGRHRLL